ncbi:pilus assembly protein [Herbaspirillum seropedicae]|uniref:pilus assembly protein n=1 Tax=Herbaspirillum seropedicae TaxID=964 RepID=UPI003F8D4CB1
MSSVIDFAHPPAQRRRRREQRFHGWLCAAALLGVLLAMAPGLRIHLHQGRLAAANALLLQEAQALASATRQAAELQTRISALQQRLAQQQQLARRRTQAGLLLRGVARASLPLVQLERLTLQKDHAELHGRAGSMAAIQELQGALAAAGLEGAHLLDLRTQASAAGEGYSWSLSIPLLAAGAAPPP